MSNTFDDQPSWLDTTGATTLATDTIISNADPSPTYDTYRKAKIAFPNTINIRSRPTPEHEITDVGAYGLKQVASINRDQPPKLQPERWLPCALVDLYAFEVVNAFFEANPHRAGDLCLIPSGAWFHSAERTGQLNLGRLDPNVSPLEYTYLAFPANGVGFHYFLCIITHPSDLLVARNPSGPVRTAILVFDSFGTSYETENLRQKLELFLLKLSLGQSLRKSELKSAKLVRVPVRAARTLWKLLHANIILANRCLANQIVAIADCTQDISFQSSCRTQRLTQHTVW